MKGSSSLYVTTLPGLVGVGIVAVELIFFSSYRMTLRDHLFKGLCDLMGGSFF